MDQNENDGKVQEALADISVIRQTMVRSRVQLDRLSKLFFIYGGAMIFAMGGYLLYNFFSYTGIYPTPEQMKLQHNIWLGFIWCYHLIPIAISVIYFIWRHDMKKTENNYTMYLYDMWGYALFVVPAVWILCSLGRLFAPGMINMNTWTAMTMLFWLVEQMMFFVGLAATGFLLNSEDWKILSVLFIFLHLLSFVFFSGISNGGMSASELFDHWFSIVAVWTMLCGAIGIILAIWFRYKRLKDYPKYDKNE